MSIYVNQACIAGKGVEERSWPKIRHGDGNDDACAPCKQLQLLELESLQHSLGCWTRCNTTRLVM